MCFWKKRIDLETIDVQMELAGEAVPIKRKIAIVKALLPWVRMQEHAYLVTADAAKRLQVHVRLDTYVSSVQAVQQWLLNKDVVRPAVVGGEHGWVALFPDYRDLYYACEAAKHALQTTRDSIAV